MNIFHNRLHKHICTAAILHGIFIEFVQCKLNAGFYEKADYYRSPDILAG